MPKGKTKSKLKLSERRETAFTYFARGLSDSEVRKRLRVSQPTVRSYRKLYEETLFDVARSNPTLLNDAMSNTLRSLVELDQIRSDAWKRLENRKIKQDADCPDCGAEFEVVLNVPVSDQARVQYHNVLIRAQEQRAKTLGILGVKQEVFQMIAAVKYVQDQLLAWMQRHLDGESREKLELFLAQPEIAQYIERYSQTPALDVASTIEDIEAA